MHELYIKWAVALYESYLDIGTRETRSGRIILKTVHSGLKVLLCCPVGPGPYTLVRAASRYGKLRTAHHHLCSRGVHDPEMPDRDRIDRA